MAYSSFFKQLLFALSVLFIVSCDSDFNDVGTDVIGEDINYDLIKYEANVVAYDKGTGSVQSNNLPTNTLGTLVNPVFGTTVAHFVTQVQLETQNPTLYEPVLDSVYIYIPYYSTLKSTDASTGINTYTLDSIYGNATQDMKLSIYRNGFYLRDADPGSANTLQKYYTSDKNLVESNLVGDKLNNSTDPIENDKFIFAATEIKRQATVSGTVKTVETLAPGMFINLDKATMQQAILNAGSANLQNNSIFKNYFRGLYFKVEQNGNNSIMAMPRFAEGKITIKYNDFTLKSVDADGNNVYVKDDAGNNKRTQKTMTLTLTGNTVNFFDTSYNNNYLTGINTSNETDGDSRLYLKGGEGSVAYIDILNDTDLAFLKKKSDTDRILVNEASLTFYIDQDKVTGMGQMTNTRTTPEPKRVYLYDVKNKRPVYDYYTDVTEYSANKKFDKYVHGGILETSSDGQGYRYKIRITDHINNILNKDSTNVKLALVVTENINLISNAVLRTPFTTGAEGKQQNVTTVPAASVMHPFGTVLYGNTPDVPDEKRLKLEIYYTKPTTD